MGNLKIKDGAKILYNLYKGYFNRLAIREIYVSLELTKKQKQKFRQYNDSLPEEEIWAYANRIVALPEDEDLLSEREKDFAKKDFLQKSISPLVKVFTPKGKRYTVNSFILFNQLLNDDFDAIMYWLCEEKSITEEEANQVIESVIRFLEK